MDFLGLSCPEIRLKNRIFQHFIKDSLLLLNNVKLFLVYQYPSKSPCKFSTFKHKTDLKNTSKSSPFGFQNSVKENV